MEIMLDDNTQPLSAAFNHRRNRQKALSCLLGVCESILSDDEISPEEVVFLKVWLDNASILRDDPDYVDIICTLEDLLEDRLTPMEEEYDLQVLLQDFVAFRAHEAEIGVDYQLQVLLGFLHGIMAEESTSETEMLALKAWINRSFIDSTTWPVTVLRKSISDILADGILKGDELKHLEKVTSSIIGNEQLLAFRGSISTTLPIEVTPSIEFRDKTYCATGRFVYGTRKRIENAIISRGGLTASSITKKTNYLIIGTLSSRDWTHTSFGRKIEKAVHIRDAGVNIQILHEDQFIPAL